MDDDLIQASQAGDIDALYELIKNDKVDLKRIDEIMLVDTPLHIAASSGQTCFAMEMMNLMPSFARKLNKDGLSPIHLALLKGHSDLVLLLLRADRELVRVKGRGGMTPLHYATKNGNIDLLADFLAAYPKSIEDMTVESETVLHIAVKNNMLEAVEVLVGWFQRVCHGDVSSWKTNILNWRDTQGNTVLDIAVSSMQIEAIQLLAEIKAKNSKGLTAVGALQRKTKMGRRVVRQMLRNTRVSSTKITFANYLRSKTKCDEKVAVYIIRQRMLISEDMRNALLVVAGVIVAANFQAVFSPPGNVRQEDGNPTIVINGTYINTTVTNTTAGGGSPSNNSGKSVMDAELFLSFSITNTFVLYTVIVIIGLLLSDGLFGDYLILMLGSLLSCYAISIYVISPDRVIGVFYLPLLLLFTLFLISVLILFRRGKEKIEQLRYNANKCPKEAAADEVEDNDASTTRTKYYIRMILDTLKRIWL